MTTMTTATIDRRTTAAQHYRTEGMTLHVRAYWADAASPITYCWVAPGCRPETWLHTPYQVANAHHDSRRALAMVRAWTGSAL